MTVLTSLREQVGRADREFRCCDTEFVVRATGVRADTAADAARRTAKTLESELDAFDDASPVSRLNATGRVENEHVARVVRRGLEYYHRTDHVFDIHQGRVEHDLKTFLRGDSDSLPDTFDTGAVRLDGDLVVTETRLDLNGLAKGYLVDRAGAELDGIGRDGFVSGGGDMTPPTGPVGIESPFDGDRPLKVLDTDYHVATSGGYRRVRDGVDHIYDPVHERVGARHESVTVLARRDCMEADALATTLAALPLADAVSLAEAWEGLEALVVHEGVLRPTTGFDNHVVDD